MQASYQQQDTSWGDSLDTDSDRPGAVGALVAGLLALLGGGALCGAPFLDYLDDGDGARTQIDSIAWPEPAFYLGVAGLTALAGLLAVVAPRRTAGTFGAGLAVVPAAAVGGFQLSQVLGARRALGGRFTDSAELGLWLVLGGAGLAALAAVAAFLVAMARVRPSGGAALPLLGAVAAVGLLEWWVVAPLWAQPDGDFQPLFTYLNSGADDTWSAVATISALGLMIAAVAVAAGRTGSASVGIALGAAFAVGGEVAARFLSDSGDLRSALSGEVRTVPNVLTGVAAGVLLLLAICLAVSAANQPLPDSTEDTSSAWATSDYSTPSSDSDSTWGSAGGQDSWDSGGTTSSAWAQPAEQADAWKRDEDTTRAGGSWASADSGGGSWASDDESTARGSSYPGQSNWPQT